MNPSKEALRRTYRAIREKCSPAFQEAASNKICTHIRELPQYRYATHIALYIAVQGEVNLTKLWSSASKHDKRCYFPKLNQDKTLMFLPADEHTPFADNQYKIPEPAVSLNLACPVETLDILFMPLVAFDTMGNRLGTGSGYYDRTLASKHTALRIGVAYEFQRHEGLVSQPWDIPLHAIVTEKDIYWSNR